MPTNYKNKRPNKHKRTIKRTQIRKNKPTKYIRQLGGTTDFSAILDKFKEEKINVPKDRIKIHIGMLRYTAGSGIKFKSSKETKKYLRQHKNTILANKLEEFIQLIAPIYNFIDRLKENLYTTSGLNNNEAIAKVVIDTINESNHSMMKYPLLAAKIDIQPSNNQIEIKNCVPELFELLHHYYGCLDFQNQGNYFLECRNLEDAGFQDNCPSAEDSFLFKRIMEYLVPKKTIIFNSEESELNSGDQELNSEETEI